jgi:hypothetical protein
VTTKIVKYVVVALLFFEVTFFQITNDKASATISNSHSIYKNNEKQSKEKVNEQIRTVYNEQKVIEVIIKDIESQENLTEYQLELINRIKKSLEQMDITLQQLLKENQ